MKRKKLPPLEPVDLKRCQTEWTDYTPFIMGGDVYQKRRCEAIPVWVAKEKKPGEDGRRGAMSVCAEHREVMEKEMPGHAAFTRIRLVAGRI